MRSVSGDVRFVRSYPLASFGHVQNFERTPPDKDVRWMNVKAWSHRRTDMYRRENGLKYAEFGYPVTKFISSVAQSSRDRYVEPGS